MNKLDNPSNVKTSEDLPFCFPFQGYEFFFFFACAKKQKQKKKRTNPVLFHYMLLFFYSLILLSFRTKGIGNETKCELPNSQ